MLCKLFQGCDLTLAEDENYYEVIIDNEDSDNPLVVDICVNCIQDSLLQYILKDNYESLSIYKCKNEIGD